MKKQNLLECKRQVDFSRFHIAPLFFGKMDICRNSQLLFRVPCKGLN